MTTRLLGEVCDIIGGGTPSKKQATYYGGSIPWASVRDMSTSWLSSTEFTITEEGLRNSSSKVIPSGEVVIATRVGLGKVCLLGQDTAINQDLRGLIPKSDIPIDRSFLFYWYRSISSKVVDAGTGATVQGVKLPFVKSLEIPLPPLKEQQRIVAILDEAFANLETARANAEANLENAKELFQSVLNDSLSGAEEKGWEVKQLGEVCFFQRGLTYTKKDEVVSSVTCVLRANNVSLETGELDLSDLKFISDALEIPDNKKVKKGSLLICTASGSKSHLGKVALVRDEVDFAFGGFMGLLTPKECLLSFYLHYLMKSDCYKDFIDGLASGTNINNLKWSQLFNFEIPLPPLEEQQCIVEKLDALRAETDRLQQQYTTQITDLEDLRQSLLQQAFVGELT